MSNLKRCDRCGVSVPVLNQLRPEGWIYLGVYNGLDDTVTVAYDICPACMDAAAEFFKPSAEKA